jgi:hypothetical protein
MLSLITGPQRSGKSYFCVTFILTYLEKTNRPILTNLPLNVDNICLHLFGKYERNPAKWENVFLRIKLFLDYSDLDVLRHFAKNNPRFVSWSYSYPYVRYLLKDGSYVENSKGNFVKSSFSDYIEIKEKDKILSDLILLRKKRKLKKEDITLFEHFKKFHNIIIPKTIVKVDDEGNSILDKNKKEQVIHWGIRRFWSYVSPNSIIFLDELYQYFSSLDYRAGSKLRLELLTFTRQHGHDKHDLYLISHKLNDLDVCLRNGVQYLYVVRNMKYHNLFKHHLLRGFKSPVQFFRISGVMDCEYSATTEWDDIYSIKPRKEVFRCYDSFSRIETFSTIGASDDASSSDINTSPMVNITNYLRQSWIPLVMVLGLVSGLIFGVIKIRQFLGKSTSTTVSNIDESSKNNVVKKDFKVVSVSSSRVVWDDGFSLKVNDLYKRLKVYAIKKKFIVFKYNDKLYNVKFSGIRDARNQTENKVKSKKI